MSAINVFLNSGKVKKIILIVVCILILLLMYRSFIKIKIGNNDPELLLRAKMKEILEKQKEIKSEEEEIEIKTIEDVKEKEIVYQETNKIPYIIKNRNKKIDSIYIRDNIRELFENHNIFNVHFDSNLMVYYDKNENMYFNTTRRYITINSYLNSGYNNILEDYNIFINQYKNDLMDSNLPNKVEIEGIGKFYITEDNKNEIENSNLKQIEYIS